MLVTPLWVMGQYRSAGSISGNYFGATAEVGITSFFGDIPEGAAQGDLSNNLAYKLQVSKNFNSVVEFSGRISIGKMSGEKKRSSSYLYFKNEFVEYSADLGINIMSFFGAHKGKFGLYANIGIGLIDFKVKLYDGTNDSLIQSYGYEGQKSTTEFVVPLGGRAVYHISKSSAVSMQTTISWVDTDKLDGKTGNDNTDFYNYFSVGYTYKFGTSSNSKKRRRSGSMRLNNQRPRYRR